MGLRVTESPLQWSTGPVVEIGPYQTVREMGRGGTGVVWLCRHRSTGADAAVKIVANASHRKRTILRREIAMLWRLAAADRPGIVRLLESGDDGGRLWYAMELVRGVSLLDIVRARARPSPWSPNAIAARDHERSRLTTLLDPQAPAIGTRRKPPPGGEASTTPADFAELSSPDQETALWIVAKIADALSFLHQEGIVHGDLSPANVLVREDFTPVLIDFGLAFQAAGGGSGREVAQEQGRPLGTPGFMAPEQIRGDLLDARCDLYALGCILHELILERPPFEADTVSSLLTQHLEHRLRPLTKADGSPVDPGLSDLITGLLEKDPRRRLGHAEEVVGRLQTIYQGERRIPVVRATGGIYRPRLVGRDLVLERFGALLDGVRTGAAGRRLIVVGESGAGKTRVLNEVAARALKLGFDVVPGRCGTVAGEDSRPRAPALHGFAPFLQRYADRAVSEPRLIDDMRQSLAQLAPYEPGIAALSIGENEPIGPLSPGMGFAVVMRALASALLRYSREQPVLVVLDDLQWADELTLSFWISAERYLPPNAAVSIIAASRANEGNARLLDWLRSHPAEVIEVGRLRAAEIRTVARDMLGTDMLPARLADVLEQRSGGNPFFVAEYLRAFTARGWLRRDSDGWTFADLEDRASMFVPSSVEALFAERFAGLNLQAQALMQLAAVLGRQFDRDLLAAVLEPMQFAPEGADIALDELVGRQILDRVSGEHYQFTHDQVREAVLRSMAQKELAVLNLQVARCFESLRGTLPTITAERLGVHLANAGEAAEALPHLKQAAAEADAVYAVSRAIELYRLALAQAERIAPPGSAADGPELQLAEALADVLARSARHDEARDLYRRALLVLTSAVSTTASRLLRKEAQSHFTVHRYDDANRALDEAEARLPPPGERADAAWREWIELQQTRFWTLYYQRKTGPETTAHIARMRPVVLERGTAMQRSITHRCAASDLAGRLRYRPSDEVVALNRAALAEIEHVPGTALERAAARFAIGFALVRGDEGQCREAAELLASVAEGADRMGDMTLLARAQTYRAVALRRLADTEATDRAAADAFAASEAAQLAPYMGAALACRAWVAWGAGKNASARAGCQEAAALWARSRHSFPFRWLANLLLVDLCRAEEDFSGATSTIDDLLASDQQMLDDPVWSSLLAARQACASGTPVDLDRALHRAVEDARRGRYL